MLYISHSVNKNRLTMLRTVKQDTKVSTVGQKNSPFSTSMNLQYIFICHMADRRVMPLVFVVI